jgi:hypothetical protein
VTDIYTPEGVLDYAEAARSLAAIKGVNNHLINAQTVARVNAAALLDIAVSLNRLTVLAEGAEFPLGSDAPDDDEREVGPDGEPLGEPERGDDEPIEVGDWVARRDEPEAEHPTLWRVDALGESEGAAWFENESLGRVWLEGYVKTNPPGSTLHIDDEPTGRDMVDEIDADFDEAPEVGGVRPRCGAAHPDIDVTCARKLAVDGAPHDGKHRKGNLKWV